MAELQTGQAIDSDTQRETDRQTDGEPEGIRTRPEGRDEERPARDGGRQRLPKGMGETETEAQRDRHALGQTRRLRGRRGGEKKRVEAGVAGSGGHGAGAAERAGAREPARKSCAERGNCRQNR